MLKIFFSYTLRDGSINKAFLLQLRKWICSQGQECYIDLLDNSYNENGFQEKLEGILKECDVFCKIDSSGYNNSKWTQKELLVAESYNKKISVVNYANLIFAVKKNKSFSKTLQV